MFERLNLNHISVEQVQDSATNTIKCDLPIVKKQIDMGINNSYVLNIGMFAEDNIFVVFYDQNQKIAELNRNNGSLTIAAFTTKTINIFGNIKAKRMNIQSAGTINITSSMIEADNIQVAEQQAFKQPQKVPAGNIKVKNESHLSIEEFANDAQLDSMFVIGSNVYVSDPDFQEIPFAIYEKTNPDFKKVPCTITEYEAAKKLKEKNTHYFGPETYDITISECRVKIIDSGPVNSTPHHTIQNPNRFFGINSQFVNRALSSISPSTSENLVKFSH